jgi:hypothetical protein
VVPTPRGDRVCVYIRGDYWLSRVLGGGMGCVGCSRRGSSWRVGWAGVAGVDIGGGIMGVGYCNS